VILSATLFGYGTSGAVLTLALPLGLFIVVMIVLYLVFSRRRTVPGRRTIAGAKPVAPEPPADRATPPKAGARGADIPADDDDTAVIDTAVSGTAVSGTAAGDTAAGDTAAGDTEVEGTE
jgi:hypothetical protein